MGVRNSEEKRFQSLEIDCREVKPVAGKVATLVGIHEVVFVRQLGLRVFPGHSNDERTARF